MELWIRSQDKEKLKKIVDLKYQYGTLQDANLKVIVGTTQYDEWDVLGSYATKERALEVLDEIQGTMKKMEFVKLTFGLIPPKEYDQEKIDIMFSNFVYEMPKE